MPHAFISYSRKDSPFVERLERDLNARGVVTWRDQHNIPGGEEWYQAIVAALDDAYAMLCVVSPNADESRWVLREQLYADQRGVTRIPLLPAPHRMPFHLLETQPIACTEADYAAGLAQISAALAACQGRTPATAPPSLDPAVAAYLDFLLAETKADLRDALYVELSALAERRPPAERAASALGFGLDDDFGFERLGLERVHGEDFSRPGDEVADARPLLDDLRRVILLGEPGAGKTTTLLQWAVDLARKAQQDAAAPLPVYIPLRQYDGAAPFETFVQAQMATLQSQYARLLAAGRLILLCDALNEMPRRPAPGGDTVSAVRAYLRDKTRWVVSCRVRDYQDELGALRDAAKVQLRPLDPPRIQQMIARRFAQGGQPEQGAALWAALYGSDDLLRAWEAFAAAGQGAAFWEYVDWPESVPLRAEKYPRWSAESQARRAMLGDRRRLLPLCRTPYMTTMVCQLYRSSKGVLPENRGALFAAFVDELLKREERAAQAVGLPWIDAATIRAGLAQIAYTLGSATEMARARAEAMLHAQLPGADAALLLRLAAAANLLDAGQAVRFTHQLLQEYFASEVLGALLDADVPAVSLWPPDRWWQPGGREETALILAGVRGDPQAVARWLAPAQPELAVQVLTDSGVAIALNDLDAATRAALVDGARAKIDEADPLGRAAAYRALALLGADERRGVGVALTPSPSPSGRGEENAAETPPQPLPKALGRGQGWVPDIDWVEIPGGAFIYQNGEKRHLDTFFISRYPVTFAQFQCFLDDPQGHADPRWFEGLAVDEADRAMHEQAFKYPNHPRECVNWYQAVAFCRWLSWRLGGPFDLDDVSAWRARLPTEMEWEKAARGSDGRAYPWGAEFDAAKCNSSVGGHGIGMTSAVGLFAQGASPYGVHDLAGNVWEWCLTAYGDPAPDASRENMRSDLGRVLRGGSWIDFLTDRFRCDDRYWVNPLGGNDYGGFRLALSQRF